MHKKRHEIFIMVCAGLLILLVILAIIYGDAYLTLVGIILGITPLFLKIY